MGKTKLAKRAAALQACIRLHKMGELDDNLKPKHLSIDEDTGFLFKHWPAMNDKGAGNTKTKRMHKKEVIAKNFTYNLMNVGSIADTKFL